MSFSLVSEQHRRGSTLNGFSDFSRIFEIIIICFVVVVCDLVHDVETMNGIC